MNTIKMLILCVFGEFILIGSTDALNKQLNSYTLMNAVDVGNSTSNVTISNDTGRSISVAGLFIASFDVNDCSTCFGSVVSGDNLGGAVVSPFTFKNNQTVSIGQNYLYNMIYNGIYYIKNTVGSSPCSLPGCSWPGDDPNIRGWCITINITSLDSNYTSSAYTNGSNLPANAPPYSAAGNSTPFNYNYDLINPNTLGTGNACIGPVVCNDKTLTCKVSVAQNESFQPY